MADEAAAEVRYQRAPRPLLSEAHIATLRSLGAAGPFRLGAPYDEAYGVTIEDARGATLLGIHYWRDSAQQVAAALCAVLNDLHGAGAIASAAAPASAEARAPGVTEDAIKHAIGHTCPPFVLPRPRLTWLQRLWLKLAGYLPNAGARKAAPGKKARP